MIKDKGGDTFLEIPLTLAAVGVIAVPVLAAIGAPAALVSDFTIVLEKVEAKPKAKDSSLEVLERDTGSQT
jgi:hypothetical protein